MCLLIQMLRIVIVFIFQISCFCIAYITGTRQAPLRIAGLSKRWDPTRIPTPRFINAWTANEKDGLSDSLAPVLLNSDCKNIVVLRAGNMSDKEKAGVVCTTWSDMFLPRVRRNKVRATRRSQH